MNTFKAEVNKIILGLTSIGLVLLMLPVSLSAHHFRYGTMSWENPWDNGTIILKMQNGWSANHTMFRRDIDYDIGAGTGTGFVSGYIGSIKNNLESIDWGDSSTDSAFDIKIISRDNVTPTNYDCDSSGSKVCILSTISEMGEWDNSTGGEIWTLGLTHTYPVNGTTEYVVSWASSSRASVENSNGNPFRNETKVKIGGAYSGNNSPVSAVPPVIQVQDNKTFNYQLVATDADDDSLNFRWGKVNEFFSADGSGSTDNFTMPTGMTLSTSGLISWDVRDSVLCSGCSQDDVNDVDDLWVAVIMIEDRLDNGTVKSYIPIDFFFKISSASNDPPEFTKFPTGTRTVSVGNTKTIKIKSTDDSGDAPTITVLNPPSDNSSIWGNSTSTSGGETTFTISFTPDSSMGNKSYAVNIRSTDNAGMTKDQSLGLKVSSVINADPSVPILLSPADNSTVTEPVTFQWEKSTDSDGDTVSYNIYICTNSGFVGCSGTSVTAGGNFVPPFNENFHDNLIPWPSTLHAATVSRQISQDPSMIPKWVIMLGVLGLLSGIIYRLRSLSVKNITHRRIVFMFIFLTFCFSLTIISCSEKEEYGEGWEKTGYTPPVTNTTSDNLTYTTSDLTTNTTYYWKVIASDIKGGSAESETWSFKVK
jgi:hypothetical protein